MDEVEQQARSLQERVIGGSRTCPPQTKNPPRRYGSGCFQFCSSRTVRIAQVPLPRRCRTSLSHCRLSLAVSSLSLTDSSRCSRACLSSKSAAIYLRKSGTSGIRRYSNRSQTDRNALRHRSLGHAAITSTSISSAMGSGSGKPRRPASVVRAAMTSPGSPGARSSLAEAIVSGRVSDKSGGRSGRWIPGSSCHDSLQHSSRSTCVVLGEACGCSRRGTMF